MHSASWRKGSSTLCPKNEDINNLVVSRTPRVDINTPRVAAQRKEGIKWDSFTQSHFPKRFYSQDAAPAAPGAPDAPTASSHMPEESAKLACEFTQKTPSQHQTSPVESSRVTRRAGAAERAGQLQAEMEEEKKKYEKGTEKIGGGCAECEGGTERKEEDAEEKISETEQLQAVIKEEKRRREEERGVTRGVDERGRRDSSSSYQQAEFGRERAE